MNTQPFSQTCQMTELCCEHLSVRCISLYLLAMVCTSFRVNPHSVVDWRQRNYFLETGTKSVAEMTATGLSRTTNKSVNKHSTINQTAQMIELCCEYLSAPYISLYVVIMPGTHFKVNRYSIVVWMSRNSLFERAGNLAFKQLHSNPQLLSL